MAKNLLHSNNISPEIMIIANDKLSEFKDLFKNQI